MTWNELILISMVAVGMFFSFFFSGSETGIYKISRLRVRLGMERKDFLYVLLGKVMSDNSGLLISILIGNNLANYMTTSAVTFLILQRTGSERLAEVLTTIIMAPFLFAFCELMPKSIFYYRADSLTPYTALLVYSVKKLCDVTGINYILKHFTRFCAQITGKSYLPRAAVTGTKESYIKTILQDTREEGFLSQVQAEIINRLAQLPHLNLRSVMVPLNNVKSLSIDSRYEDVMEFIRRYTYTRVPLFEEDPSRITGYLNIYKYLTDPVASKRAALNSMEPMESLASDVSITEAINYMNRRNLKMVLIVRPASGGKYKALGIVTMKDLVEEIFGELTEW